MTLSFPPPPAPEETSAPCPHCGNRRAVLFYNTSVSSYLLCAGCHQVWLAEGEHERN